MAKQKKDKEQMEIRHTGVTKTEFNRMEKNNEPLQCYLCKRKEGEKTVQYSVSHEKYVTTKIELGFFSVVDERKDAIWNHEYMVCFECVILLRGLGKHLYITGERNIPFPGWPRK